MLVLLMRHRNQLASHDVSRNVEHVERDLARFNAIQSVGSPRNPVESVDLIDGTKYSGSIHCLNVINASF